MSELIEVEDRGSVRLLAINRPELRNAINTSVLLQMRKAVPEAAGAEALRALVITGRGGAFSGGADVKEWADKIKGIDPHPDHDWVEEAIKLVQDVFNFPKPTVAMIDGPAVGAGLDMALACDFRVASARAKFICAYTRIGYPPDCGGSWLMPRLMGIEAAKMFAYTGEAWSAEKAHSHGMVTEVVAPEELEAAAFALADKLASGPTVAIGLAKGLIDSAHRRTLAEQQMEEQRAGKICGKTADHAEGLAAANERRVPHFVGR
jgi:2-(1,2-epoxy-1,2-dihydrophenyl)acetyl-CoA isomerase